MKKVYVNAYLSKNFGDDLFIKILSDRYKNTFYAITNKKYNYSLNSNMIFKYSFFNKVLNKIIFKNSLIDLQKKIIMDKCDIFLTIGGSMFVENCSNYENIFLKKYTSSIPQYMIGVNFGPYTNSEFYNFVKENIIKKNKDVCFRDSYSYNKFSDLKNCRFAPDIVFSIDRNLYSNVDNKTVVFTLMDVSHGIGEEYKKDYDSKMIELIKYYGDNNYNIKLVSLCEADNDLNEIKYIFNQLSPEIKAKVKIVNYSGNVEDILKEFAQCDTVIGTRFHSIVLGILFNKKIVPISYNVKTINMLKDLNYNEKIFTVQKITDLKVEVLKSLKKCEIDIDKLSSSASKHFEVLDKILERK